MKLCHIRKSQFFIFSWPLILVNLLISIPYIKSQNISKNNNEILNFNQTLQKYNNIKLHLNDITKKMENITLNIFLLSRLDELKELHKKIENRLFLGIQEEINRGEYDKEKISKEIIDLNRQMNEFEEKYNKTNKMFYKGERDKQSLIKFIKIFFLILIILTVVALIVIGIGSFFVVKNQKKYYKLQEEISFSRKNKRNPKEINFGTQSIDKLSSEEKKVEKEKFHSNENDLNSKEEFKEEYAKDVK